MALVGGKLVQVLGGGQILGNTAAVRKVVGEAVFSHRIALRGGGTVPADGQRAVMMKLEAGAVHPAQLGFAFGVAECRAGLEIFERAGMVGGDGAEAMGVEIAEYEVGASYLGPGRQAEVLKPGGDVLPDTRAEKKALPDVGLGGGISGRGAFLEPGKGGGLVPRRAGDRAGQAGHCDDGARAGAGLGSEESKKKQLRQHSRIVPLRVSGRGSSGVLGRWWFRGRGPERRLSRREA